MESTTLTINNQAFEHLKTRTYRGVSIYRGSESFLRIGPHKEINRERNDHAHLLSQHFPVAHILEYGEYRDQAYYIEESLGTQTISDLFIEDTEKKWAISSLHFESFLALIERLTRAQIQSREVQAKSVTDFAHGILIEQLISEKPDWTDRIHALFTQIQNRLSVFPSVFVQGDCNPRNLFPKGIIDFDAGFIGPLWYDQITAIFHIYSFPPSGIAEYARGYTFTNEQEKRFFEVIDPIFLGAWLPKISDYRDDFLMARLIWSAVGMSDIPQLQAWRYEKLNRIIEAYLWGKSILELHKGS